MVRVNFGQRVILDRNCFKVLAGHSDMRDTLDRGLFWTVGYFGRRETLDQRRTFDSGKLWTEGNFGQRAILDSGILCTEGNFGLKTYF